MKNTLCRIETMNDRKKMVKHSFEIVQDFFFSRPDDILQDDFETASVILQYAFSPLFL